MILDLKEILNSDGEIFNFNFAVLMQPINYMGEQYKFADDVEFSGYAKNISGTVEVNALIKGTLIIPCARCTKDTEYDFLLPYNELFENFQSSSQYGIMLEDVILEAVICDIPIRVLCKDDCKGLCPKCGADLNKENCGCPEKESNLIWEKLKNLNLKDEV